MGWLRSRSFPQKYDPSSFLRAWEELRTALNYLDYRNFPNLISANDILESHSMSLDRLGQGQLGFTLVALAQAYTTTSTTLVNVGPYWHFDPLRWPSDPTKFALHITAGPVDSNGQMVVELHSVDGAIAGKTLTTPGLNWYSIEFAKLPTASQTLLLKVRTTNAATAASLLGASIIITP